MSLNDKITEAQHRIESIWNETDGKCYVSFSGGKDSTVLLALIKQCQELGTVGDIPAVFSNTGIELGVTVDFVKWVKENWYPGVVVIRPVHPFSWVLQNEGKPMISKMKSKLLNQYKRGGWTPALKGLLIDGVTSNGNKTTRTKIADKYIHILHDDFPVYPSYKCCEWMKKKPFKKFQKENGCKGSMQGIRQSEGGARSSGLMNHVASGGKPCTWTKDGIIQKAPIIDWTDQDVEDFVKEYNVPLSEAYTKYGFDRTGCMACPYSKHVDHDLEYLYFREPSRYKASMHWLKDVYIAQNVKLPFDESYEAERKKKWNDVYEPMRQEMLRKYRPNSRLLLKKQYW